MSVDISNAHSPNISFVEAARQAEEAARAAEGAPVEETAPPVEAEAVVAGDESAPVAEETPAETLLAGKYKTVDDLERAHSELQQFADRQSNEIGDLRRAFDERFAEMERRQAEPAPQRVQVTSALIDSNPAYAAQVAYEQGDVGTLQVAYEQWNAIDEVAANTWLAQTQAAEREKQMRSEYDAKLAALEQRIGPLTAATEGEELRRGVEALPAEARAFLSDQAHVEALANEFPSIGTVIVSGTPAQRLEAVKALWEIQRGRTADTLATSTQEVARQTAVEAQQARDEAHVASTQTASADEPKTREQIEQEAAVAAFTRRRGVWDDAFVRPGSK